MLDLFFLVTFVANIVVKAFLSKFRLHYRIPFSKVIQTLVIKMSYQNE